jgi:GNAT superfamily N-acetyltransferase
VSAGPAEAGGLRALRRARLPTGSELVVRPSSPADLDRIEALYAELTPEDLRRRFFAAMHPAQIEHWLHDRAGYWLVAESDGRIVGEAGYAGQADLAVLPRWRGWLGPYLLDVLLDEATRRGVPHLVADILWENRPMLALMRSRGSVVVERPDAGIVRVAVVAAGRVGVPTG